MIEINEKQLRVAFRNPSTATMPFSNIAHRLMYKCMYGIEHHEEVCVYGKRQKTVAIAWWEGYKLRKIVLGKFPANAKGYADAAEAIDHYFNQ